MSVNSVQELFVQELQDIYHAEKQLLKAMPKMARKVQSEALKQIFQEHLEETRGQVERLEQVFDQLDLRKRGKPCHAMEGLVEEAKEVMDEVEDEEVRDVAMIVAAQKVEHYEIASYGSLVALAKELGHKDAVPLLEETLKQEKAADEKLNKLALSSVNPSAAKEEEAAPKPAKAPRAKKSTA